MLFFLFITSCLSLILNRNKNQIYGLVLTISPLIFKLSEIKGRLYQISIVIYHIDYKHLYLGKRLKVTLIGSDGFVYLKCPLQHDSNIYWGWGHKKNISDCLIVCHLSLKQN
jgi:hypothetical protein